jgi:hypothetical protein
MITWLYGMALQNEQMYAKPTQSGTDVGGDEDDEPERTSNKYDGIGGRGNKQ